MERKINAVLLPLLERLEPQYVADDDPVKEAERGLEETINKITVNLGKFATGAAERMVDRENTFHRKRFIAEIKKAVGIDISSIATDDGIDILLERRVAENVDLINTIPSEYFDRVRKTVTEGIARGDDFFSIRENLKKDFKITEGRARTIARDQVSKMNGALNEFRQNDIGITHYTWRTSEDERVRKSHKKNDGKRFAWNDPPSETGHPGNDVNCRCVADPDLSHFLALGT
jgi:SPP1 gp7 family putative phage head morphogenesis protein